MTDKEFCIEFIDGKPIGAVGERFNYDYHDAKIIDNQTGKTYDEDNYHMLVIDGLLNQLNNENEQLKTTIQQLTNDNTKQKKKLNTTMKENEQLKEHQRTLEAKIVRLKDRVKTFEKHYSLKDIERYKKMDNCNCIDSRRLEK